MKNEIVSLIRAYTSATVAEAEAAANALLSRRASDATPADERDDTIDGLRSDLEAAVEVAYKRGATEWVRLNYPDQFKKLSATSPAPVPGDLVAGRGILSDVPEMGLVEWLRWYGFGRCPEAADRIEWLQMRVAVLESEIQQTVQILETDRLLWRVSAKRIAALEQALRAINVLTSPGNRTLDELIRDMGYACDRARAALGENNE